MHPRTMLGCSNWSGGSEVSGGVLRRAYPASGAQWNVQVVRGKVNGKCLWNACKALSIGLLLMVLGGAMATIGYYAEHLSVASEVRGNYTVRIRNESRGFHLNNLSYAGPIVMGVGGFIVVAACVMTFEARDSAAKVVPARLKTGSNIQCTHRPITSTHGSLRTSSSQTGAMTNPPPSGDRHILTQSFLQFSKGLMLDERRSLNLLQASQNSITKCPSAPDLSEQKTKTDSKQSSPLHPCKDETTRGKSTERNVKKSHMAYDGYNPRLLYRHALSVDETAHTRRLSSQESLQGVDSQCSMALDLHLDCPITLKIRDRRRNPLKRQGKVDTEDERQLHEHVTRSSSHSPRLTHQHRTKSNTSGSPGLSPSSTFCDHRRSSNASDCTKRRECQHHHRGRLERAISSDSRFAGAPHHKCHHHHHRHCRRGVHPQSSIELPDAHVVSSSDTDIRHSRTKYPNV